MKRTQIVLAVVMLSLACISGSVAQYALVNQAGYLPDQPKYAYFISPDDSFYVVEKSSGAIRFSGQIVASSNGKDPATGLRTYRGDFSAFTQDGTYQISTPSGDTSESFQISRSVFEDVYKKSLKGYYFQRCGSTLVAANAGVYARPICHTKDAVFHSTTGKSGSALTPGGWHDAGDYGKYVVNGGITVGTLLMAYELAPAKFRYDDLNIPESGNGTPDILDEVRYELEWFLTMQDTSDGGVFFKVTTANFDGFEMPDKDISTRYIYQKSSTATGNFAGCLAQAARLYTPFDAAFAARCLAAARKAWQFLQANPAIVPTGGFKNPPGTGTGEYGDVNDSDERLWSAAELYETTGEAAFRSYFEAHYTDSGVFASTMAWPNLAPLAQATYLLSKQPDASATIKTQLRNALTTYCDALASIAAVDGLNVTLQTGDYCWGSNGGALNNAVLLILGYIETGTQSYTVTALQQLNYVLGCNRINQSFVTGVGTVHTMQPHHRPSQSDGIAEPIPGLMSGGPDKNLEDNILKANFTSTTPPARCYMDDWQSYASNEICLNWNAPLVLVAGYLNEAAVTSVAQEKPVVPSGFELAQNYPNPFNPTTGIRYQIPKASDVKISVHDMLGREVAVLVNERKAPGAYEVPFNGSRLASGVYIYRLTAGSSVQSRKMVLVK